MIRKENKLAPVQLSLNIRFFVASNVKYKEFIDVWDYHRGRGKMNFLTVSPIATGAH